MANWRLLVLAAVIAGAACGEPRTMTPTTRIIPLRIAGRHAEGPAADARPVDQVVRVSQDDVVVLRWTTDEPLLVHLHGYEIKIQAAAGSASDLTFAANAAGRFVLEGHWADGTARTLAYLEVQPR